MEDEKLDDASSREQQIATLHCGMTNKKQATTKTKTKCGGSSLRSE
jgi:hypothetical protein